MWRGFVSYEVIGRGSRPSQERVLSPMPVQLMFLALLSMQMAFPVQCHVIRLAVFELSFWHMYVYYVIYTLS